jgi:Flp pilus assembly protein TadG
MIVRKTTQKSSHSFGEGGRSSHRISVREDVGQAFVELALVLPILTLLIVGGVEVGRLTYADIEVSNAARAGVAYAMQGHAAVASSQYTLIETVAKQDAPDIPGLVVDPPVLSCYCESSVGVSTASSCTTINTNTTGVGACPSPSSIVIYVQINTHADVNTAFHFPGIPSTVTLRGTASMRVEQQ